MNNETGDRKDEVYAAPMDSIEPFRFDASVADVFQDMISRSVPGYGMVLQFIGVLAEQFARPDTNIYDLGCSLGASTLQLRRHVPSSCQVIGIDNSAAMVERCRANMARDHSAAAWEVRQQDLRDTPIENASLVVLSFTLQFVPDDMRQAAIDRIADGLIPGGVLLLAEKVRFEDTGTQDMMTRLHHAFKSAQGYSDLEIAQKRAALENVLVPNTEDEHLQRLTAAGFSQSYCAMRSLNFSTFVGIR